MTRIAIAVLALCLIVIGAYWAGGRDDRLRDELNNKDTLERMKNAPDPNLDDDGVLDWLRNFAK